MKKLGLLVATGLLFLTHPTFGALSPLYQSLAEFQEILNSKEIGEALPQGETIRSIFREGNNYFVETDQMQMRVEIVYKPSDRVGPRQFQLVFYKPQKLVQ